jgi:hypothetical protein
MKKVILITLLCIFIILYIITILFLIKKIKEKIENYNYYDNTHIWTYWEPKPAPKIVQKCYENWKSKGKLTNIHLLYPGNINKFIPIDEFDKISKNINKRDLLINGIDTDIFVDYIDYALLNRKFLK